MPGTRRAAGPLRRRPGPGPVLATLALALAAPAAASTVRYQTLAEMAVDADRILTGEVLGIRSQISARGDAIHTFVTIGVEEFLKGGRSGGGIVTLRILGGEAGRYALVVPGSPRFELGEHVLVFSAGAAGRIPTVLGMAAGKFRIDEDPRTGERTVSRSLAGLNLEDGDGAAVSHEAASPPGRVTLDEIRSAILGAVPAP